MTMFTALIVALGAAGIAMAAPAAAQDVRPNQPLERHDMPGMHADDAHADRHDAVTHLNRGVHDGRGWQDGRRDWRHHRHCRTVWRHHHRVRRCW